MNNSIQFSEFCVALNQLKAKIDNDLLPSAGYLQVDDRELIAAMENLSAKIENHFNSFELNVCPVDIMKG